MKLRLLLLVLVTSPLFASAAPRLSQMLIGTWHYAGKDGSCTYTLRSDGSFSGELKAKGKVSCRFSGHWSISGSTIHYEYRSSSPKCISAGSTDDDRLIEISPVHFLIVAFDGSRRVYRRVESGD